MMGQFQTSLSEIARAVTQHGALPRPEPDPPDGPPLYAATAQPYQHYTPQPNVPQPYFPNQPPPSHNYYQLPHASITHHQPAQPGYQQCCSPPYATANPWPPYQPDPLYQPLLARHRTCWDPPVWDTPGQHPYHDYSAYDQPPGSSWAPPFQTSDSAALQRFQNVGYTDRVPMMITDNGVDRTEPLGMPCDPVMPDLDPNMQVDALVSQMDASEHRQLPHSESRSWPLNPPPQTAPPFLDQQPAAVSDWHPPSLCSTTTISPPGSPFIRYGSKELFADDIDESVHSRQVNYDDIETDQLLNGDQIGEEDVLLDIDEVLHVAIEKQLVTDFSDVIAQPVDVKKPKLSKLDDHILLSLPLKVGEIYSPTLYTPRFADLIWDTHGTGEIPDAAQLSEQVTPVEYLDVLTKTGEKTCISNNNPQYVPYDVNDQYCELFEKLSKRYKQKAGTRVASLQKQLHRYALIPLGAEYSKLSSADNEVLALVVKPTRIIDSCFFIQVYFAVNKSSWSSLDEYEAFLTTADSAVTLLPEATEPMVGWTGMEYNAKASDLLHKVAYLTSCSSLKKLLHSKADAFLSNEYYDTDIAGMEVDSQWNISIGPYETFEETLLGCKATFTVFIGVQDDGATGHLILFGDHFYILARNLPLDELDIAMEKGYATAFLKCTRSHHRFSKSCDGNELLPVIAFDPGGLADEGVVMDSDDESFGLHSKELIDGMVLVETHEHQEPREVFLDGHISELERFLVSWFPP